VVQLHGLGQPDLAHPDFVIDGTQRDLIPGVGFSIGQSLGVKAIPVVPVCLTSVLSRWRLASMKAASLLAQHWGNLAGLALSIQRPADSFNGIIHGVVRKKGRNSGVGMLLGGYDPGTC
jgi:hypothetical protein